ncbi:MAG: TatD family hydrolase [Candidatus Peregrinibacteria bacterium]|nr:TatD family hydrolase [Candidatus Peregrinibacteria bacterium]
MLIDTHCHLMEPHFKADVASVLQNSALAGVSKLLNIGCHLEGSRDSDCMCRPEYLKEIEGILGDNAILPQIYGSQGIHPHDSNQTTDEVMGDFEKVIRSNKRIVVIGETGLDYFYMNQPKEMQLSSLRKHMVLAEETGLPVSIHCRDAADSLEARKDMLRILAEFPKVRCVMHCFVQDQEYADAVLAMPVGHILSFGGVVTYPSSEALRKVASGVPVDRFVVETDSPYLTPQAFRGKRNEPAFVVATAKVLAEVRGVEVEEIERLTNGTAERFFGILGSNY